MAIRVFAGNSIGTGIRADLNGNDKAIVTEAATVASTDDTAIVTFGSFQSVNVDGAVYGETAVAFVGVLSSANLLRVGRTGDLQSFGANGTVAVGSARTIVENQGTIWGDQRAILLSGNGDAASRVINSGTIEAHRFEAIRHSGNEVLIVTNSGLIKDTDGFAIRSDSSSAITVVNSGSVIGDIQFGFGNDFYDGRSGHLRSGDFIHGGDGSDALYGGIEDDAFFGGGGNDKLVGGSGNDFLDGGLRVDSMVGGIGSDTYVVDDAGDVVSETGGNGKDTVQSTISFSLADAARVVGAVENLTLLSAAVVGTGNTFNNLIVGNAAANIVSGLTGMDTLLGGSGADTLLGGAAIDTLCGDAGADRLIGGTGGDRLAGGLDADRFIFKSITESRSTGGRDTILDFSRAQLDRVDLSAIDANIKVAGNQAFAFIGKAAFSGHAGELRYQKVGADTHITADVNGDKVVDFTIVSDLSLSFVKADFLL